MRFLSRFNGLLLSGNVTWRLFARSKLVQASTTGRLRVLHTRMAHVVSPAPQIRILGDKELGISRLLALISRFGTLFARSPPDLSERLLSIITPYPGLVCAAALCSSLYSAVPLDHSIRTVIQILPRTANAIVKNDFGLEDTGEPGNFQDRVKSFLIVMLRKDLHEFIHQPKLALKPTGTSPSRVLAGALFSASAVKIGLLDETFIYAFTRFGLQLPASGTCEDSDEREAVEAIAAVGACLQLSTAGTVFMEKLTETDSLADIIAALEALRVKNTVTLPRHLDLLDKTIELAKANFVNPLSPSDALNILSSPEGFGWGCVCLE